MLGSGSRGGRIYVKVVPIIIFRGDLLAVHRLTKQRAGFELHDLARPQDDRFPGLWIPAPATGLCLTSYEPKPENKTLLSFSNASLISSM